VIVETGSSLNLTEVLVEIAPLIVVVFAGDERGKFKAGV